MNALDGLAWARIGFGAAALAAPNATLFKPFGLTATPELTYITRTYGARALAIGTNFVMSKTAHERRRWHRLGLAIDTSDTVAGLLAATRGGNPMRAAISYPAVTLAAAAVGLHQLRAEQKR